MGVGGSKLAEGVDGAFCHGLVLVEEELLVGGRELAQLVGGDGEEGFLGFVEVEVEDIFEGVDDLIFVFLDVALINNFGVDLNSLT